MAIITDKQCAKMRQFLHSEHLSLMQAESPPLTKAEYLAAYQALEDFWENNRANLKAAMDSAVGRTISVQLAKKIGKFWLQHKWGLE